MKDYLYGKQKGNCIFYEYTKDTLEDALNETDEYVIEMEYEDIETKIETITSGILTFYTKGNCLKETIYLIDNSIKIDKKEEIPFKLIMDNLDEVSKKDLDENEIFKTSLILSSGSKNVVLKEIYLEDNIFNFDFYVESPDFGTDNIKNVNIFVLIPKTIVSNKKDYIFRFIDKHI